MDWQSLEQAIFAWEDYARSEEADATRRVRQVAYLLHRIDRGRHSFLPMRLLMGWILGIPFSQQGGRNIGIKDRFSALADMGLARIDEASPFFEAYWDTYQGYCDELGNPPACYIGDNPRTGRVFWAFPAMIG